MYKRPIKERLNFYYEFDKVNGFNIFSDRNNQIENDIEELGLNEVKVISNQISQFFDKYDNTFFSRTIKFNEPENKFYINSFDDCYSFSSIINGTEKEEVDEINDWIKSYCLNNKIKFREYLNKKIEQAVDDYILKQISVKIKPVDEDGLIDIEQILEDERLDIEAEAKKRDKKIFFKGIVVGFIFFYLLSIIFK